MAKTLQVQASDFRDGLVMVGVVYQQLQRHCLKLLDYDDELFQDLKTQTERNFLPCSILHLLADGFADATGVGETVAHCLPSRALR